LHFARKITYEIEMAAARALARVVTINDLCEDHIIPDALDKNGGPIVAKAWSEHLTFCSKHFYFYFVLTTIPN
jgi:malic enzyme